MAAAGPVQCPQLYLKVLPSQGRAVGGYRAVCDNQGSIALTWGRGSMASVAVIHGGCAWAKLLLGELPGR